jgi:hypothetical protein
MLPNAGATLGRHYADIYPIWAELADRHGHILFLRSGHHYITFGEHAAIVAALVMERPYATPIGGGPEVGPIYVADGHALAQAVVRDLIRCGHGVTVREPERIPLTSDETYQPARLVHLTDDAAVATPPGGPGEKEAAA